MELEEIKKVLESYDVKSDIDSIFQDWVVTTDGDLINVKDRCPIYSYEVNRNDWLVHLKEKKWFDRPSFISAFKRACNILGISVDLNEQY